MFENKTRLKIRTHPLSIDENGYRVRRGVASCHVLASMCNVSEIILTAKGQITKALSVFRVVK